MVKVAVAGGTGDIAREVIDKILAKNQHEVIVLTHRPLSSQSKDLGAVKHVHVDYTDTHGLTAVLMGTDVVLSFLASVDFDAAIKAQKNLIDASIKAGVRRIAPSEWACPDNTFLPHYKWKDAVRDYLENINRDEKKIEYTLFQPGLITNFFAYPHSTTRHFSKFPWFVDFENRRAIVVGDGDQHFTTTTVEDLSSVVAEAIDYKGEWPVRGGVAGSRVTVMQLIKLAENLRGPIKVDRITVEDLQAGHFTASWAWLPSIKHPDLTPAQGEAFLKQIMVAYTLSTAKGAWDGTNEWNLRLPGYQFVGAEEYLRDVWENVR
ncbi:hypothetical protein FB567DRAFT_537185 [Paraphoma chrysanthemicola]|uniref:NmrA-like domain-containing protein n=1 Tax=Paraphoma chrysanthemicola TaxID=798071 RepID=A0A8K0QUF4_9PLEO|nr:hypothetical protein FB567DRAFT_537185 [Paraphoma chrysanthemicola]